MAIARQAKTLQEMDPKSMTISEHMAELPASITAGAKKLRATPPCVRAYATLQPISILQTASMAAFAALLSRYGLKAELEATDGQLSVRMSRREDNRVSP